jgi:hypothetical protein
MAYGIVLVFEGVSEDDYWGVHEKLGLNRNNEGPTPAGLITHFGGSAPNGWVVTELWESKAHQEAWMSGKLGAALQALQLPAPAQVIEVDVVNNF